MDLSIIIVNWNTRELLQKCLVSLFRFTANVSYEIFVVDNASSDDSAAMVKNNFPELKLIINKTNLGFAKANNLAINHATGRYVLLLNPDTELIDNALGDLVAFMDSNPAAAIAGSKLLFPNGSLQSSVRRLPRLADQFLILLKFHNFLPNLLPIKKYYCADFDYNSPKEVEQVMGAAMLIRREVFAQIGPLDEKFWFIFEEVDFCERALAAGLKIYYYPNAAIIHYKGQSMSRHKILARQINFNHNLFYYFRKHRPFYQLIILWLTQPISLLFALLDQSFNIQKIFGKNKNL